MPPSGPIALVRPPGHSFSQAISTHPDSGTLNFDLAWQQHRLYREALTRAGYEVVTLPSLPDLPDSTFIEDNAVVLNGKAWLCPNREPTRQAEAYWTGQNLVQFIEVGKIEPAVHFDGGDVLVTEEKLFVGLSSRTSVSAVPALQKITTLEVVGVTVHEGLHLKSAATYLGNNTILLDPSRLDTAPFKDIQKIEVPVEESYAANTITLGKNLIMAEGYFGTQTRLEQASYEIQTVPMSEFEKADGGLTCLSLILPGMRPEADGSNPVRK